MQIVHGKDGKTRKNAELGTNLSWGFAMGLCRRHEEDCPRKERKNTEKRGSGVQFEVHFTLQVSPGVCGNSNTDCASMMSADGFPIPCFSVESVENMYF